MSISSIARWADRPREGRTAASRLMTLASRAHIRGLLPRSTMSARADLACKHSMALL